ncbi:MAG: TolC family protein [Alphaproteobacteria bacterium]|nr:TolC family protein [Alphaproteobacteria bacterium]
MSWIYGGGFALLLRDFKVTQQDVNASETTLAAEVVSNWLGIVAHQKRIDLRREQLSTNRVQLELVDLRYKKGRATALDVYQQRQVVAQTESQLPKLEAKLTSLKNSLAVLLGEIPQKDFEIKSDDFPIISTIPEVGLPADLLSQRPDVIKAQHRFP